MNAVEDAVCSAANFVGNRLSTCLDLVGPDKKTLREKYHIGEPRDCPAGNSEQMKRRGFVGIYQKSSTIVFRLPNSNIRITKTW